MLLPDKIMYCSSNGAGKNYLALGSTHELILRNTQGAFEKLSEFITGNDTWVFGCLSYDLKNDTESLTSNNSDGLDFPNLMFFKPKTVVEVSESSYNVIFGKGKYTSDDIDEILLKLSQENGKVSIETSSIQGRTTKDQYIQNARKILNHIQKGDIYELNYCQEFYVEDKEIDPYASYAKLNRLAKAPYSCFLKYDSDFLMSASPELFLQKNGPKIISKPIKGTRPRSENPKEDQNMISELKTDAKELAENVMIVDVVRNDLSRTAKKNSVKVTELCAIYSFETVHQMISTVESEIEPETEVIEVIKKAFPMGSMTGAPKIRAMEIIEQLEDFKRGLYSGAVGYFEPNGDFTFNVVIRSILYNEKKKFVSLAAGGAFTALSEIEKEYDETLLKADALFKSLIENGKEI